MQRKPFKPLTHPQSKRKLELVHSDVCGPLQVESIGGSRYFVTFVDDYSRCVSVYFIKHKAEVFGKFKLFEAMVTKECGESIMKLRTDNGGEYTSKDFQTYLASKGIEHQLTVPHSPQQNGVAERQNRTLMESARAMLSHSNLPNKFWAEAVATAAYLRNRTTTCANEQQLTPFERWYGHKPDISHLRVFGCAAYCHVPSTERRKLDKKAQRMCFIGYSKNPKGYRLIDLNTEKVVTRRDVAFNETDFRLFKQTDDESVSILPELLNESDNESTEFESQPAEPPRRSQRAVQRPDYFGYSESTDTAIAESADTATLAEHCAYSVQEISEPVTIGEALSGPHAKEWKFGLADANTVLIPADCDVKLVKDDHISKPADQVDYQSMVGCLIYVAKCTRPDIDLQVPTNSIVIKEDNQGAITLARNPVAHSRTKHIDIHFHFIRKAQEEGIVDIVYCRTSGMVADLLTKSISRNKFEKLRTLMGMEERID